VYICVLTHVYIDIFIHLHVYIGIFIYIHYMYKWEYSYINMQACAFTHMQRLTHSLSRTHTLRKHAFTTRHTCRRRRHVKTSPKRPTYMEKRMKKRPTKEPCVFSVVHASASQNGSVDGESQWTVYMKTYTPMYSKRYLQMIYLTYKYIGVSIYSLSCLRAHPIYMIR